MPEITLIIRWPSSVETIHLGNLETISAGTKLTTLERWPGYEQKTRYEATIEEIQRSATTFSINVRYRREENSGQALENEFWGISRFNIKPSEATATAAWIDERASGEFDTKGVVQVLSEADIIDLGRVTRTIQKRDQQRLRNVLLEMDGGCAITGEKTPASLEAVHLVEVKDNGGFAPGNGFLLRADLHRLFDARLLNIETDGSITIADELRNSTEYSNLADTAQMNASVLARINRRLQERNRSATDA